MTEGTRWWKEQDSGHKPRARWLGILKRPVKLDEHVPNCLTIPSARIFKPELLSISNHECFSTPNSLTISCTAESARNLIDASIHEVERGTVSLTNISLNEEPLPRRTSPPRRTALTETLDDLERPHEAELPLFKRLAYLLQPPADLLLSHAGPLEWPGTLFEYQIEGIQTLLSKDALLLADDMGLGKTVQAIAALRILVVQRHIESALLIVPAGLVTQWRKELYHWAPELRVSTIRGQSTERAWQWNTPVHVYLTSYETFRSDFTDNPFSPPRRRTWDLVVLDEAQKIKNRDTEASRKCKRLNRRRAWVLTGTPLENREDDLASIMEFVTPFTDNQGILRLTPGPELRERHKDLQLRRKKMDVLPQLPPKIISQISLSMSGPQRESYDRAETEGVIELRESAAPVRVENVLTLIMKLKQICNFCPIAGHSVKLDDILERLDELDTEGHRALIFSQFTDSRYGAHAIASKLMKFNPLIYTGELSPQQRDAAIQQFKENRNNKVLVLSLRAGGQGLNLQDASYIFHFDRWWNPAVEHQAEGRAHRIGQSLPVHVYRYIIESTIEERIDKILREKQLLFDELVDGVSLDLKSKLTAEELFGLFGLVPPTGPKTPQEKVGPTINYSEMSGIEFEEHVKRLLEGKQWNAELTPPTRDGGIDIIARRTDDLGVRVTLYVQCKNHSSPAGVDTVRELVGALPRQFLGIRGVLVCPSGFTADAMDFAKERDIMLWDRHHLFELSNK